MIMKSRTKIIIFDYLNIIIDLYIIKCYYYSERGDGMGASKQIKQVMIEKNVKLNELAEKIGMKPQPLSNKLYRDTMSFSDVEDIADILDCDVKIVDRESGKQF